MLRSDTLMLDNEPFPLYQERVTSLTFITAHSSTHFGLDALSGDEEHCEMTLVMTGILDTGSAKHRITKINLSLFYCFICNCVKIMSEPWFTVTSVSEFVECKISQGVCQPTWQPN